MGVWGADQCQEPAPAKPVLCWHSPKGTMRRFAALPGPRGAVGAAVMRETSGPESTNSCDHFSYFKPLGTRRLPSHGPGTVTQHPSQALSQGQDPKCRSAGSRFDFLKEREFHLLSACLVPGTVLGFPTHHLIQCHPHIYAEPSVIHR